MLLDSNPTPYDLKFRLGDIPVRVQPSFWLVSALLGSALKVPVLVLMWVVAVFLAVLVHEMGHALMSRWFGNRPHIVLYSAGGYASYAPYRETFGSRLAVIFAGPGAGFLLAALILAVCWAASVAVLVNPVGRWIDLSEGERVPGVYPQLLIGNVLFICIWWGLINLLPIYPLDGGQIARLLWMKRDPILGPSRAAMLSLWTACGATLYCAMVYRDSLFLPLFFGFLAYENYRAIQATRTWR